MAAALGGMRPGALVVSTPNKGYNEVLRGLLPLEQWPGRPGADGLPMRRADHQREWGRADFRGWAAGLGEKFGYGVRCGPKGPRWAGGVCVVPAL
jgi:hypothetical protein